MAQWELELQVGILNVPLRTEFCVSDPPDPTQEGVLYFFALGH